MSNGQRLADVYPTWIRVDFPVEREITKVVLKKRPLAEKRESWSKLPVKGAQEFGRGMPSKLSVEASADGLNWTKIFDGTLPDSDKKDVFEFTTAPLKAKMVRVVATEIPLVECEGHCFAIAEFEVCDKSGRNVAEISNGTGILASSSYNYNRFSYEFHGALWKIHNELGAKLIRMGYHDDPINWHCVERERGVLKVDKTADEAINTFIKDGAKIVMCLNFGNRLYTGQKGVANGKAVDSAREIPQMPEWYYEQPSPPATDEALAAWDKYVEFMAKRYADKVEYFEIWNEWNIDLYWGAPVDIDLFLKISKRSIDIIRRVAPKAKIMMGAVSHYPQGCENWGDSDWEKQAKGREKLTVCAMKELAPLVDAVGIHPYYQREPAEIEQFERDFPAFKKWLAKNGFKGKIMISEWNFSSVYPSIPDDEAPNIWRGKVKFSEIQRAKFIAQRYVTDTGNGVPSYFCEAYNPFYGAFELSLLRRATDEGACTLQPSAAFYAVRNIATITDGFEPLDFDIKAASKTDISKLRKYAFKTPKGYAAALWIGVNAADKSERRPVDIFVPFKFSSASATDVLNGARQNLKMSADGKLKNVMLNDTPLIVEFER